VSQNKLHKRFVSELRQMLINFNNFWLADNRIAKVLYHIYISHLTSLTSPHYLVKHKSPKFVNNASRRFETWQHWNTFIDQSINQSIKYSFIDKKDNPPDTNASGFYRRVGGGKNKNN